MSGFEIFVIVLLFCLSYIPAMPNHGSAIMDLFIRTCVLFISLVPFVFIFKWPWRIKSNRFRKRILQNKPSVIIGFVLRKEHIDTGRKTTQAVTDGFTQQIGGGGGTYWHYHFEDFTVFDGYMIEVEVFDANNQTSKNTNMTLRTLPRSFSYKEETIPETRDFLMIKYTTYNGINYIVDAKPYVID